MSMIFKASAGLIAGLVAGGLGLAFFPRMERNALTPRAAVEKPQFVATAPAAKGPAPDVQTTVAPAAPPAPVAAIAPSPAVTSSAAPVAAMASPSPAAKATPLTYSAPSPTATSLASAPKPPDPTSAPQPDAGSAPWSVRGLVALAHGDLSSARVFLTRAAEAGDPRALVALADTYDPAMLTKFGVVGAPGDAQRARDYLARAAAAGVVSAKDRIAALEQNAH